jgi:uncharacterized protein
MKPLAGTIRLSATDLSNHLACRHVTTLDLRVAHGRKSAPDWAAPHLAVIRELGKQHETAYLDYLLHQKRMAVVNLADIKDETLVIEETLRLMEQGAEIIAQGALADGKWIGRPDVLRRVTTPVAKWNWSYEVADTKLAPDTKAGTILQLSLYSDLLEQVQGGGPEWMWVIPSGQNFAGEAYRVADYAAYFRYVKSRLERVAQNGVTDGTYPEPVPHCDVCRWFRECDAQRRGDDHLSLVAGIRRQQRNQLEEWETETMAKLAVLPIPLKERPDHGSREAIERVREQARVQVLGRTENKLVYELLPVAEEKGFCTLPEPSPHDIFLDLEGDPFVGESGLQYLFGFAFKNPGGEMLYERRWALSREEEKKRFEWLVDQIVSRRETNPQMHVYHFGAYEPGVLKRLMGLYATRQDEIDDMLWERTFVDLHSIFKQSLRASVEEYSLKQLEQLYAFKRNTPLDLSRGAMRYVEHRLELGQQDEELPEPIREALEGYNKDDCLSTANLRDWLETKRQEILESGNIVPRPSPKERPPQDELDEWEERVAVLSARLTADIPADAAERTSEQQARWLLANILDWHRREKKATHWEGFRLRDLDDAELLEERAGLAGLKFAERLVVERRIPIDRYTFERQETEAREGSELYYKGEKFGTVTRIDTVKRTINIKKTGKTAEIHPIAVYVWKWPVKTTDHAEALLRIGNWVADNGIDAPGDYRAIRDLLLRKPPRLPDNEKLAQTAAETPINTASRVALALQDSVFAIQGPPGAGKTYTGARMICELVSRGRKVGIMAFSHKAIHKLLKELQIEAGGFDKGIRCVRKITDEDPTEQLDGVELTKKPDIPLLRLQSGNTHVAAGTVWLWARADYFQSVDTLVIDEAGQMSLADVLAAGQCARNLVLLGDPQQLEQPLQGSHPDGAEKSALEHLLNGRKTIPEGMGFLLPESWRLHPEVCKFTSSVFYEGKLTSHAIAQARVLEGHPWLNGAGLWFVPVEHEGNRNSCAEEVDIVARIVQGLLKPEVRWFYSAGNSRRLKEEDILIVAPYNAQVADLLLRLPKLRIGTVDKFQGQEAPIVIYSLTTSSPEDAPRGMEFLYSLNRLNVATSRAMSTVILVGSSLLFEPDCRTPRQMQLANAFCRFAEMARLNDRGA